MKRVAPRESRKTGENGSIEPNGMGMTCTATGPIILCRQILEERVSLEPHMGEIRSNAVTSGDKGAMLRDMSRRKKRIEAIESTALSATGMSFTKIGNLN